MPLTKLSSKGASTHVAASRNLASTIKTAPMWEDITPRWLLMLLPWKQIEAGKVRINRVADREPDLDNGKEVPGHPVASAEHPPLTPLDPTYAQYEDRPEEFDLTTVQTIVEIDTRTADLYSAPFDQVHEQLRLSINAIKEMKEDTAINGNIGLLNRADPKMRVSTISGPPSPDDLDNLLAKVWKWPAFFLAHPRAISAFGRECNTKGIALDTVEMFGVPFVTWRGVPLVPSNKIPVAGGTTATGRGRKAAAKKPANAGEKTSILLMRTGEERQGVIGLHLAGVGDDKFQSLSIRFMGINDQGVSRYLVTCYFSVTALVPDALGVLENVVV
jgi:hypothetical protein